jgi:hypothetical protein
MANPHPRDLPAELSAPRTSSNLSVLVNSLVALVLGTGITVLLHELAHWVTGAALGSRATLFAFGVTYQPQPTGATAAIAAAAGPVASLVVGSVMQVLQPFRFRGDFAHLLWIWVAVTSLMEAATYLVITPYAGDTATIVRELNWPAWTAWVAAAIGLVAMVGVAQQWAIHSVRLCGHDLTRLRCFSWYPWLIGVVVLVGLAFVTTSLAGMQLTPRERTVVLLAGVAQTVFAPMSLPLTRRVTELEEPLLVKQVPWLGLAACVVLIGFNLAIGGGIALG